MLVRSIGKLENLPHTLRPQHVCITWHRGRVPIYRQSFVIKWSPSKWVGISFWSAWGVSCVVVMDLWGISQAISVPQAWWNEEHECFAQAGTPYVASPTVFRSEYLCWNVTKVHDTSMSIPEWHGSSVLGSVTVLAALTSWGCHWLLLLSALESTELWYISWYWLIDLTVTRELVKLAKIDQKRLMRGQRNCILV